MLLTLEKKIPFGEWFMSCRESPIRLRWKTRRHIIDEHFCRENVDTCSTFYRDISFRMVFERFKAQFREGTLEKEDPRSSRNLVYFCLFDRVVGSSPSQYGRKRLRSRHVRVPCVRSSCRNCSHPVIVIKTFFSGWTAQTDLLKNQTYEAKTQGSEMKNMLLFYIVVTK